MPARSTLAVFLSKVAHQADKFGYDEVVYVNNSTKVKILCKIHNEYFMMRPADHLNGQGCPMCREDNRGRKTRLPQEVFEEKGHAKHGRAYDYSKAVYVNSITKVTIICKKHGEFTQGASSHLAGHGCPECALDVIRKPDKGNWYQENKDKVLSRSKKRYEEKKEEILAKCKEYRNNNIEKIREIDKRWYSNNKARASSNSVRHRMSPAKFSAFGGRLPAEDGVVENNGLVTILCKHCRKRFTPTTGQCHSRIAATVSTVKGDSNFYCSEKCKRSCSIYGVSKFRRGEKNTTEAARSCQNSMRKNLKLMQCDSVGHNYCERCGDIIDVDMHHTLPVGEHGVAGNESSAMILLRAGCHVYLHSQCK